MGKVTTRKYCKFCKWTHNKKGNKQDDILFCDNFYIHVHKHQSCSEFSRCKTIRQEEG
jgi:hypothetical protein